MNASTIFKKILIFSFIVLFGISFLYLIHFLWVMTVLIVIGIATGASGMIQCFTCHKRIGMFGMFTRTGDREFIQMRGYQPPEGMSKYDELCQSCLDNIVKTQVQKKLLNNGKYSKELNVIQNVFGVWNLGWRYGTLSLLVNCFMMYSMASFAMLLTEYHNDSEPYIVPVSAIVVVLLIFPFYCMINWYFIKKYNTRVRAIQKSNVSHN